MTSPVVADTNVVSYIYRKDSVARPYMEQMANHHAIILFQTYEDLLFGVLTSDWRQRRIDRLLQYVDTNYDIVEYDLELVKICARLRADSRRRGRELKQGDAWIAATAILLRCPLLSHDRDLGNPPELRVIRCG